MLCVCKILLEFVTEDLLYSKAASVQLLAILKHPWNFSAECYPAGLVNYISVPDSQILIDPWHILIYILLWLTKFVNDFTEKNIVIICLLTHWGRVTHICIMKLAIIGSYNGLSTGRHQAIIWTNAGILFQSIGTNFSEILSKIHTISFKKMHLKMLSAKCQPF